MRTTASLTLLTFPIAGGSLGVLTLNLMTFCALTLSFQKAVGSLLRGSTHTREAGGGSMPPTPPPNPDPLWEDVRILRTKRGQVDNLDDRVRVRERAGDGQAFAQGIYYNAASNIFAQKLFCVSNFQIVSLFSIPLQ